MTRDEIFMRAAFRLARLSMPHPNPPVGALVVLEGRVVGLGHHERAGLAHAEAVAIAAAGRRARGADLYVSLEPCNHVGRTGPCVDAIFAAGIRRVVVGCADPNPVVRGGGCPRLESGGVSIVRGPWQDEAEAVIAAWRETLIAPIYSELLAK